MTQPLPVPVAHFDTSLIEPELRLEAWQQNMGVMFDLLDPNGDALALEANAKIDVCNLGETIFGVTRAPSQLFERSARRIAHDDIDHLLIQVFLEGGGITSDRQKVTAGDMLVIDLGQPHKMLNTHFANLTLVLPRDLHTGLTDLLTPWHGRPLQGANPMVKFIGQHMMNLWQHVPEMSMVQAGAAVHGSLGLMQALLSRDSTLEEEAAPEVSTELGRVIRRYIASHLGDNLTAKSLAGTFHISRSQIYRIFKSQGGVARYIWQRRLRQSMQLLSQPIHAHKNIGTIAFECGFSSEAHFSRSFRSHFGVSPSQARADARAAHLASSEPGLRANDYATHLATWIRQL